MPPRTAPTRTAPRMVRCGTPDFISGIHADHQMKVAHVFILHGNIYDFCDNAGNDLLVHHVLARKYDNNVQRGLDPQAVLNHSDNGVQTTDRTSEKIRVVAFYNSSQGLEFAHETSKTQWEDAMRQGMADAWAHNDGNPPSPLYFTPRSPDQAFALFNDWFRVSKKQCKENRARLEENPSAALQKEVCLTLVITDSDALFPIGDIAHLSADRAAIVTIRNWAQDKLIGDRNRIILMTRHLSNIHESIRSELAARHVIRKPNLADRREWIVNCDTNVKIKVANKGGPVKVGDNANVTGIILAPEFTFEEMAIQSAGMNRRQIKDVIMNSWHTGQPIDFPMVQDRKKRALEDEYGGILDMIEPKHGFDQVGGHQHFKDYCEWQIIRPMKAGLRNKVSRGAIMLGPPGTGKTMLALALAKDAGMNFIQVDLGQLFGGLVGESERKSRQLIEALEAASPCIAFFDEIDSSGLARTSAGDSGTSARIFNYLMTWLSDGARRGKVVALFASNRPDLLDSAFIRYGRIDAKIPCLPASKTDVQGRWAILAAQTRKNKIVLSPELQATRNNPKNGLGLMLMDQERYWTGAEIEEVLNLAQLRSDRVAAETGGPATVDIAQWNYAVENTCPTGEVEHQIDLALEYSTLAYVPEEWKERAKEVKQKAAERDRLRAA